VWGRTLLGKCMLPCPWHTCVLLRIFQAFRLCKAFPYRGQCSETGLEQGTMLLRHILYCMSQFCICHKPYYRSTRWVLDASAFRIAMMYVQIMFAVSLRWYLPLMQVMLNADVWESSKWNRSKTSLLFCLHMWVETLINVCSAMCYFNIVRAKHNKQYWEYTTYAENKSA